MFKTGYLFFIATYGTTPGAAGVMVVKAIRGRKIDAYYSVRMADTWTPVFDLSTSEKTARFTGTTEAGIDRAIRGVSECRTSRHMFPRTPALIAELISQPIYNNSARLTAKLRVEGGCIGIVYALIVGTGEDIGYLYIMLAGGVLCAVFAGLCFKRYKKMPEA